MLRDSYGRQIRDLRISLTDRCNFRCFYCLPDGEPPLARKDTILSFEEIVRVSEIFVSLGIEKIRLTGGEPMLRRGIEVLIEKLSSLKIQSSKFKIQNSASRIPDLKLQILNEENQDQRPKTKDQRPKLKDLALTTNGFSIAEKAGLLKAKGLDRITISLDSLKRENFRRITGVDRIEDVFRAIDAAQKAGLNPVKINAVIVRGRNDDELEDFALFARERGVSMRFIEFMPLDAGGGWSREHLVSGREIFEKINKKFPLRLKQKSRGAETAWKYSFADGAPGEIGIIAPVTEMFCGACSRIRLTADGQIRTCLFSIREHNLRDLLRSGATRAEIVRFIEAAVFEKEPHHFINDENFAPASRSMSFIGG
jgi:cyclic pyranopterin phosphate synthase